MIELKTPSGYVVTLKRDYITYGEKMELQKIYLKDVKINAQGQSMSELDAADMFEAQSYLLSRLVHSVVDSQGKAVPGEAYQAILDLPEADGEHVMQKINEFTQPVTQEKKS